MNRTRVLAGKSMVHTSGGVLHTAAVMGYECAIKDDQTHRIRKGKIEAYNQVVVPELGRIAFPPQVLPDRQVVVFVCEHPHRARVEAHDVEQHPPHAEVENTFGLAEHATQAVPGPFERAAVARDAERHLGLDDLDGGVQLEEAEKVGICGWIEDYLRDE